MRRFIEVDDELWARMRRRAKDEGRTVSWLVAAALRAYLAGPDGLAPVATSHLSWGPDATSPTVGKSTIPGLMGSATR